MSLTSTNILCVAEIEAKEACDWLRAAGFPQYAQLFEGNPLPHQKINLENLTNVITPSCKAIVKFRGKLWCSHLDFETII